MYCACSTLCMCTIYHAVKPCTAVPPKGGSFYDDDCVHGVFDSPSTVLKNSQCFLRMLPNTYVVYISSHVTHVCMFVPEDVLAFLHSCACLLFLTGFGVLGWAWRPRPNHTSSHWGRACIRPRGPTRSCCQMSLQQY